MTLGYSMSDLSYSKGKKYARVLFVCIREGERDRYGGCKSKLFHSLLYFTVP